MAPATWTLTPPACLMIGRWSNTSFKFWHDSGQLQIRLFQPFDKRRHIHVRTRFADGVAVMARHGHTVDSVDAKDNAYVRIGDDYYGRDAAEDRRLQVLAWLSPPASGAPVTNRREPGTNLWFLDTHLFQSWHNGEKRFSFLHGIVGCGKTTLLSSIARKCREIQRSNEVVAAFYFSSTVNENLDLNAFLRFLTSHLCEQQKIPVPLNNLYDRHNRSFPPTSPSDDDLKEVIEALLRQPRSSLYDEPASGAAIDHMYLLVDGLDEIRDRAVRRDVTGYLTELCSLAGAKHRVLTTARPEADILTSLRADRGWRVLPIPKDSVRADIQIYVKREVTRHDELDDLDDQVRQELLNRLAGPEQVMYGIAFPFPRVFCMTNAHRFRWASLQLSRLLNARLLLRPDVFEILRSLPKDLNETYDKILGEISASHHGFASTALRWLTLARDPLFIEELIDACSISMADECRPSQERRLRPLDVLRLLPNLITVEPPIATGKGRDYEKNRHRVTLSHFSVKEYLLDDKMKLDLQAVFRIEPAPSHQLMARDCMGYLYWTNVESKRDQYYPLRQYALDFWAIHCVSSGITSTFDEEQQAVELLEAGASRQLQGKLLGLFNDATSQLPTAIERAGLPTALCDPSFDGLADQVLYGEVEPEQIRLLEILPSEHWFVPIRCTLAVSLLNNKRSYEAVSYTWGNIHESKTAWVNGQRVPVGANLSQLLRGLRSPHDRRRVWVDAVSSCQMLQHPNIIAGVYTARPNVVKMGTRGGSAQRSYGQALLLTFLQICINQHDIRDRNKQVQLMPQIFANSSQVAIWVSDDDAVDRWALNIITSIDDVLRLGRSERYPNRLRDILGMGGGLNPYVSLKALFEKAWWTRIWVVQEAVMAPQATLLYGKTSLDLHTLARIVQNLSSVVATMKQYLPDLDSAVLWESPEWKRAASLAATVDSHSRTGSVTFSQLVCATRYRKFTDLRDRFYSLLGMLQDSGNASHFNVDYRMDHRESCYNTLAAAIQFEGTLDVLSFISRREDQDRNLDLPSWASLCIWDESYAHAIPLLDTAEDENTHAPFKANTYDARPVFDHPEEMSIEGWFVARLSSEERSHHAAEPFHSAGYKRFIARRRVYQTYQGCLCLAPWESSPDDQVFILAGGKTPYVLRHRSREDYELIGEW